MTVSIDRLDWWCDECFYGEVFSSEEECRVHGEMHEAKHEAKRKNISLREDRP